MSETIFRIIITTIILTFLSLAVYVSFIADCETIKFIPIANTPARCLSK